MTLDVPDEVRSQALADGDAAWLDGLPSVLDSLARDWSLTIGATMRGGHAALVVGSHAGRRGPVSPQGRGSRRSAPARLRSDRARSRRGEELRTPDPPGPHPGRTSAREARAGDVRGYFGPSLATRHVVRHRHAILAPARRRHRLAERRRLAHRMQYLIPQLWEELGRPCSAATIDDAVECADRRERAYRRGTSVLVHGDVHEANALQTEGGTFKLIDPVGLRAEPACDLGTIVRSPPNARATTCGLGRNVWQLELASTPPQYGSGEPSIGCSAD